MTHPGPAHKDLPRLDGRTVIVTGANSGIGYEAARAFAGAGAVTVLACRNATRAAEAADRIRAESPTASIEVIELDLASLASVRRFAETVTHRYPRIDVLCNNAGIMAPPRRLTTDDGFEMQFGVNHLGHFALTGLLFDTIAGSAPSRIVTVSSLAHRRSPLDFDDLQHAGHYRAWAAYGRSKLANLLFAYELDRRATARGLGVSSIACHPGFARSNLAAGGPRAAGTKPRWWMGLGFRMAQPAAMGALPMIHAAVAADVRGGQFIGPSRLLQSRGRPAVVRPGRVALDTPAAQRLWTASEALTGVRFLD